MWFGEDRIAHEAKSNIVKALTFYIASVTVGFKYRERKRENRERGGEKNSRCILIRGREGGESARIAADICDMRTAGFSFSSQIPLPDESHRGKLMCVFAAGCERRHL